MSNPIKLIECPRDAMQGWKEFIPTPDKTRYLQSLLAVGFHTIDAGSFVSPKAIPQMADTSAVLRALDMENTSSKLLCIVANERGASEAAAFDQVTYLGFPFSISETFQQRNTNSGVDESYIRLENIAGICRSSGKELVAYISMGFGNPYGDAYSPEIVIEWAHKLAQLGIKIISLADTVGLATPEQVFESTHHLIQALPEVEIGVHLHSSPANWKEKLEAALEAGCTRIDGALKGIGGCPMAGSELVGNMDTELVIGHLQSRGLIEPLDPNALAASLQLASTIFDLKHG